MNIRSQVIFFFFFRFVHFIPFYFGYLTAWFQLESLTGKITSKFYFSFSFCFHLSLSLPTGFFMATSGSLAL
ncbi:hypothetical protein RCL_jg9812.t1 [Rhizophagus clarus]|uniref:Uncharacterized protein n=1 Tax=Rhizophagus clarus TaxID=94130 RepID=A0A8H3M074_9GLOM|nr:hypothetical protein RCL_jg9812.t1 [Rhizophagus clarus]